MLKNLTLIFLFMLFASPGFGGAGHDAGYAWAEQHGIDNPDECSGNSDSFIEGCRDYAEEQQEYAEEEDDYKEYEE